MENTVEIEREMRLCFDCQTPMWKGYVALVEDTGWPEHFCECCHGKRFTAEQWQAICEEDEDLVDNYYTEWESEYLDE